MASQQHPDRKKQEHPQMPQNVTSGPSLSQSGDDSAEDGRYSVAEEQNFDQQSDQARRVGHAPEGQGEPSKAMAGALGQGDAAEKEKLRESMERAVPRSD